MKIVVSLIILIMLYAVPVLPNSLRDVSFFQIVESNKKGKIFESYTYLKDENPAYGTEIDDIVLSEDIVSISDIDGSGRTNKADELPQYTDLTVGGTVNICPSYTYGTYNTLGNRHYIKFTISSSGKYTVTVKKSNLNGTDPDFYLQSIATHTIVVIGDDATPDSEEESMNLSAGSYILDVYDYESISDACFDVTVN